MKKAAEAPTEEIDMDQMPQAGGSYIRCPNTGNLTKVEPEPEQSATETPAAE
ncbi:MAG: hypothetical protein ACAH07_06015 [Methylophilaceae bacterium]|nr:hypothetical protein [Methyloradius sp.]